MHPAIVNTLHKQRLSCGPNSRTRAEIASAHLSESAAANAVPVDCFLDCPASLEAIPSFR